MNKPDGLCIKLPSAQIEPVSKVPGVRFARNSLDHGGHER
jgi:hypothetical protein